MKKCMKVCGDGDMEGGMTKSLREKDEMGIGDGKGRRCPTQHLKK